MLKTAPAATELGIRIGNMDVNTSSGGNLPLLLVLYAL